MWWSYIDITHIERTSTLLLGAYVLQTSYNLSRTYSVWNCMSRYIGMLSIVYELFACTGIYLYNVGIQFMEHNVLYFFNNIVFIYFFCFVHIKLFGTY